MDIDEVLNPGEGVGFWRDLAGVVWAGIKIFILAVAILWGIPLLALAAFLLIR